MSSNALPHNLDAERSVLGAIMLENEAWSSVDGVVTHADFYYPAHAQVFAAMAAMIKRHEAVDIVTVSAELRTMEVLNAIGGTQFLGEITDSIPTLAHVAAHARLVADLATNRRVILGAQSLIATAQSGVRGVALSTAADKLAAIAGSCSAEKKPTHISDMINGSLDRIEKRNKGLDRSGCRTGFPAIDLILNPMRGGQVIVVGGRPSSGKTSMVNRWFASIGVEFARNFMATNERKSGLFFSLETKEEDLADRTLCMNAAINLSKLQRDRLGKDETDRLMTAANALYNLPLYFDDGYSLTIPELRRKARRHKREHGLGIIVIDFLQLMLGDDRDGTSREREVASISRGIKALAKELDVPIVALVQLNRGTEGRTVRDHRPKTSDIRDSGSIEQDADVVAFMYRDAMYDPKADPTSAEFIITKQKNGPTETAAVRFIRESTRFEDLSETASEPPGDWTQDADRNHDDDNSDWSNAS